MHPRIIRPTDAPVERFAAAELARYLHAMTGEPLASCPSSAGTIFVGIDAYARQLRAPRARLMLDGLPPDAYVCRSVAEGLVLAGTTPRATLYAVYAWLETLGARWFFPGPSGEVVPRIEADRVRLDGWAVAESPAFAKRGVVIEPDNDALADWIDFATKTRLSTVALHGTGRLDQARSAAKSRGIDVEVEAHLLPDGLCSSDATRLATYEKLLDAALSDLPADLGDYFLWQHDGDRETCACAADAGLSVTDLTLRVYRRLCEAVRARRPGARMAFLVYLGTWKPPEWAEAAEGLFAEYAPIHRCMAHGIDNPECLVNAAEVAPELDRWGDVFPAREAQVLDYWLDSSLFGRQRFAQNAGRIPHIGPVIQHDAQAYRRRGYRSVTTFAVGVNRSYLDRWVSPALFQYPALLWDPDCDLAVQRCDFARAWLGAKDACAALEALEYVDTAGLEHGRPPDGNAALSEARRATADLVDQSPREPHRSRLTRLLAEVDHRTSWVDVVRRASLLHS